MPWARGVAWSILVALGAIDSGSNPGGPILYSIDPINQGPSGLKRNERSEVPLKRRAGPHTNQHNQLTKARLDLGGKNTPTTPSFFRREDGRAHILTNCLYKPCPHGLRGNCEAVLPRKTGGPTFHNSEYKGPHILFVVHQTLY